MRILKTLSELMGFHQVEPPRHHIPTLGRHLFDAEVAKQGRKIFAIDRDVKMNDRNLGRED